MQMSNQVLARDLVPGMTIHVPDAAMTVVSRMLVLRVEYAKTACFVGRFAEIEETLRLQVRTEAGEDTSIQLPPNLVVCLMAPLTMPERKLPREDS